MHYVGIELDSGPVVIQAEVPVQANDSAETLAARVLTLEHKIYPIAIKMHLDKRLKFDGQQLLLDNKPLMKPLKWNNDQLT